MWGGEGARGEVPDLLFNQTGISEIFPVVHRLAESQCDADERTGNGTTNPKAIGSAQVVQISNYSPANMSTVSIVSDDPVSPSGCV